MGHTGVWSNGVSIFNAKDGFSYNNMNIWFQDAFVYEGISFDACLGHPAPNGEYHHHINPTCLYDDSDSLNHSPIIGYAFDGFPIYGAYSFSNTNGTGPIKRMKSSYRLRAITQRTTLPDGTPLTAPQYGPVVSTTYPLGSFLEDYEYIQNLGDLDEHNGRFCITPEYPAGTYAYFVTINDTLYPVYPYTLGPTYYGTVQAGNTGPGSGHNTISETVVTYNPNGIPEGESLNPLFFPNPVSDFCYLFIEPIASNNFTGELISVDGKLLETFSSIQPANTYTFDLKNYPAGLYFLNVFNQEYRTVIRIIKN